MEVVHLAHDLLPPLRRRRGLVVAARGRGDRELEAEPHEAEHEAEHEAPEGAGLVGARPEDGEQVDRADGRGEVRGDGLDVVEQLRALAGLHQSEVSSEHCLHQSQLTWMMGIQTTEMATRTSTNSRPTSSSSTSLGRARRRG